MLSGLRKPLKYAVFISGSGSTLQCLLEMQHQFHIQLVVSNQPQALGLLKAKRFGKSVYITEKKIDYEKLQNILSQNQIDRIFLAGFMKILPQSFTEFWSGRMMNIHPSLLPLYPGLNSAHRSWVEKSTMGVTIHQVIAEMDQGKFFLQSPSAPQNTQLAFNEAELYLRRTEQHLLRETTLRWI